MTPALGDGESDCGMMILITKGSLDRETERERDLTWSSKRVTPELGVGESDCGMMRKSSYTLLL